MNSFLSLHLRAAVVPTLLAMAVAMPVLARPAPAAPAATSSVAGVFKRLAADRWVFREFTFTDLGFTGPLVLGPQESGRELYLPVPAGVPLDGAELKLNASYLRGDGGRTTFLMALDTFPVSSRPFAQDKGDASITLGVDGAPRPSGFVRLSLDWRTALGAEFICTDARTPGNVLRIEPDSRLTYRFDASAIRDLSTAWGALPAEPVILVSSRAPGSQAYESAWRLGLALERAGKHSRIRALPAVGDTVELDGALIPAGLRGVPAFAALAQGGSHKINDAAEVGALLSLGATGPLRGDIVVADKALGLAISAALDALRAQLQTAAPEAVAAFADWRTQALEPTARPLAAGEIRLANGLGRPVIAVAADAGAKAAGLFGAYWRRVAVTPQLVVTAADVPTGHASAVSLTYLGGKPGSFDVLARADWNATFDIGAVAADGQLPRGLVLDVAAAPSAGKTAPVVSIFINDILLGAKQLAANGKVERISAPVPRYALQGRNVLRVAFVRQLASDRCRETPEAYPVAILPSSHMLLEKAEPSGDFRGMVARFAGGAHMMVPASFLTDAPATLPRAIRLAVLTGVSPVKSRFTAVTGDTMPAPGGPFLAMELPFKDIKSQVTVDAGRLVMSDDTGKVILDLTGLNHIGIAEVVESGGSDGVIFRRVGAQAPTLEQPAVLSGGNVAVFGPAGLLDEVNTADPDGRAVVAGSVKPWLLNRGYWWMVPIVVLAFMVALLVFASRRRRQRKAAASAETSAGGG